MLGKKMVAVASVAAVGIVAGCGTEQPASVKFNPVKKETVVASAVSAGNNAELRSKAKKRREAHARAKAHARWHVQQRQGSASQSGSNVPAELERIAQCESGGSYTARNPSGAYGKYQIMPSTAAAYGCNLSTAGGQDACAVRIYAGGAGRSQWVC